MRECRQHSYRSPRRTTRCPQRKSASFGQGQQQRTPWCSWHRRRTSSWFRHCRTCSQGRPSSRRCSPSPTRGPRRQQAWQQRQREQQMLWSWWTLVGVTARIVIATFMAFGTLPFFLLLHVLPALCTTPRVLIFASLDDWLILTCARALSHCLSQLFVTWVPIQNVIRCPPSTLFHSSNGLQRFKSRPHVPIT